MYLELNKRYNGKVWVGKNYDKEIDFVAKRVDGGIDYYQVAESVATPETLARELAVLNNTGDAYSKTLLTLDLIEADDGGIRRRNVVDWLMEGDR